MKKNIKTDIGLLELMLYGIAMMLMYVVSKSWIITAIGMVLLALVLNYRGFTVNLKRLTSGLVIIILICMLAFSAAPKNNSFKPKNDDDKDKTVEKINNNENSDEESEKQDDNVTTTTVGNGYGVNNKKLPAYLERGTMSAEYGGKPAVNGIIPDTRMETNVSTTEAFDAVSKKNEDELKRKQQERIEELEKEGYTVEKQENGITVATKKDTTENNNNNNNNNQSEKESMTSEEIQDELKNMPQNNVESSVQETPSQEQPQVEQSQPQAQPQVEQQPQPQTQPQVEQPQVEQPQAQPVSITPVDGNTAYAGDSVQFSVGGDVQRVEGLDGLSYSLNGGYLTVNTNPGEATVISPMVVGIDGSTATASVTINVL